VKTTAGSTGEDWLINVQEDQLKIQEISGKWLGKQVGLQSLTKCGI